MELVEYLLCVPHWWLADKRAFVLFLFLERVKVPQRRSVDQTPAHVTDAKLVMSTRTAQKSVTATLTT